MDYNKKDIFGPFLPVYLTRSVVGWDVMVIENDMHLITFISGHI